MRKFLVIVAALLIPVGLWTAGCRQDNRQAAFPKTNEMKGLAKLDTKKKPAVPVIPAAPIDRDILDLPENATLARVNAVNDRSRQLAKPDTPEGLFTLPANGDIFAMAPAAPEYQPAPAALQPIPSAREFWSVPAAPAKRRSMNVPEDIQAMAAPARVDPVIAPPASFLAPVPAAAPASVPMALPADDLPGLFDGSPVSMRSGGPPATAPVLNSFSRNGGALGAAPLSSPGTAAESLHLDLSGLIGSDARPAARAAAPVFSTDIVVQAIPGDYEPLPEPVPLEEYRRSLAPDAALPPAAIAPPPLPSLDAPPAAPLSVRRSSAAAPAIDPAAVMALVGRKKHPAPPAQNVRPRVGTPRRTSGGIQEALAPLPDISGLAKAKPLTKPEQATTSVAKRTASPAPASVKAPPAEKANEENRVAQFSNADFFKMDFWEHDPVARAFDKEMAEPAFPAKKAVKSIETRDEEAASPVIAAVAAEKKAPPRKVTLTPIRRGAMHAIDAAMEAPPIM